VPERIFVGMPAAGNTLRVLVVAGDGPGQEILSQPNAPRPHGRWHLCLRGTYSHAG